MSIPTLYALNVSLQVVPVKNSPRFLRILPCTCATWKDYDIRVGKVKDGNASIKTARPPLATLLVLL